MEKVYSVVSQIEVKGIGLTVKKWSRCSLMSSPEIILVLSLLMHLDGKLHFQTVSHAWLSVNIRRAGRIRFELAAQITNVDP